MSESKPSGKFALSDEELRAIIGGSSDTATTLTKSSQIIVLERILRHLIDRLTQDKEDVIAINQILSELIDAQVIEEAKSSGTGVKKNTKEPVPA